MSPDPSSTPALLPADAPLALLLPVALLLLALWVRSHRWCRGLPRRARVPAAAGRILLGTATLAAAAQASRQIVTLATDWNLWLLLAGGAAAVEAVLALYRLERHAISPRLGLALSLLRVALVLAVLAVLCQPVLVLNTAREFRRHVVILLDESASMRVPDTNLSPGEKVRLAEGLALPAPARPVRLEHHAAALQSARDTLQSQADWLNALGTRDPELSARQLYKNRASLQAALTDVRAAAAAGTNALAAAAALPCLDKDSTAKTQLAELAKKLATGVQAPLAKVDARAGQWRRAATNGVAESQSTLADLQAVAAALAELATPLREAGERVDTAFYTAGTDADRAAFDRVASLPRLDVARDLLLGAGAPGVTNATPPADARSGLLARLDDTYGVRLYTVGAAPVEVSVTDLLAAAAKGRAALPAPDPGQQRRSDLAGALEKVGAGLTPERTAGILLLTDGRHNAAGAVEPIARSLGLENIPIYPVIFGGNRTPPTDAAIVSVEAPDAVSTNDRVLFNVELKADGLAGSNLTVRLYDGAQLVATNAFTPAGAMFRTRISLSDHPLTNALHDYRVVLDPITTEVDASNNVSHVPVLVNSDPVKVLLVDAFPRWEFRYVKNLFIERDQNVKLQYVLLHPDAIDGAPASPPVPASVTRPDGEIEATALPANEAEWMKFDVIVLGDVSPADLGEAGLATLNRYVLNRGGTLIVMAGALHMPHAFAGTPLEELLPVTFTPSPKPILAAPEPAFRIALTAQGRESVFMKLADDQALNAAAWNSVPDLYWRHGRVAAKETASVLAYAVPTADAMRTAQAGFVPAIDALQQQQSREREHALVVTHHAGFGNVLFLATDQMWRLRYREGDTRHHKFWGQVMRWAASDRIAAGTATLRVGADRPRYATHEPVRIRARAAAADFTPVVDATLRVTVWSGSRRIVRRSLAYVEESPGLYSAEVGALPEGHYRIELDPKDARGLPPDLTQPISAEFAVTDAIASESVELSADRALLDRVASLSNGRLLEPLDLAQVAERLGPASRRQAERRQIDLWDSWPWMILIIALFTAEWLLRKKARLP